MTLYHYSDKPLILDRTRTFVQAQHLVKPAGLWLSVGDEWKQWCDSEGFRLQCLQHRTEITVEDGAKILTLDNVNALDSFTRQYHRHGAIDGTIVWTRVAVDYQGIIIAPYLWERRLTPHTFWYYGWDCASGCIWDCSVVTAVETVLV